MTKTFAAVLSVFLIALSSGNAYAGSRLNELPECVVKTHCEIVDWEVSDLNDTFKKAVDIVTTMPRTTVVEQNDSYLHVEVTTKWMRYVDDLELKAIIENSTIQVRSESRVGVGDKGVNKKRVDELAYRLMTNQIRLVKYSSIPTSIPNRSEADNVMKHTCFSPLCPS